MMVHSHTELYSRWDMRKEGRRDQMHICERKAKVKKVI